MTFSARGAFGAAVIVPAFVVLAACGGSTSTTAPATTAPKATAQATTSAATPTSMSTPASPMYRQLTSDQLVETLLALDDMPAGYTADEVERKDSNNTTFCHYKQPNRQNGYASIMFEQSSTSVIANTMRQYDSAADASAQQNSLARAVAAGCTMHQDGTTLKVSQMSAPKLGDRTIGVSMKSPSVTFSELFVQVGPVVIMVGEGNLESPDVGKVTALAKKSIAKYNNAANQH